MAGCLPTSQGQRGNGGNDDAMIHTARTSASSASEIGETTETRGLITPTLWTAAIVNIGKEWQGIWDLSQDTGRSENLGSAS